MNMSQANDDEATAAGNIHPIRPDVTPKPQPRRGRSKDRRAAARQAKSRSKNKADRDARPAKNMLPGTPPLLAVTVAEEHGVTVSPVAPNSAARYALEWNAGPENVQRNFAPDTYTDTRPGVIPLHAL
jgi:hypothetical protein